MMKADSIDKPLSTPGGIKPGGLDEKSKAKLQKAVREFESLLVGYMLKGMRSSTLKADDAEEGFGGDIMESMFDGEMAKHISNHSNLGLGEMLYKKITGESLPKAHANMQQMHPPHVSVNPAIQKHVQRASDIPAAPAKVESVIVPTVVVPAKEQKVKSADEVVVPKALESPRLLGKKAKTDTLSQRIQGYEKLIQVAADTHAVDPKLLKAVMASESSGRADARSPRNAKGLMQLIDSTAADMGVKNVWDPQENILGGAKYLKQLLKRFDGDVKLAVASYNAGPGAVQKHNGIPPFKETTEYVKRVLNYMQVFENEGSNQ